MEHEVFVPFPADTVRQALVDPARVARCVPGLQLDADEALQAPDTLAGRLRLRIAGSTITYRGSLRIAEQDGGDLAVEAAGTEVRGDGSVKLALIVRLSAAEGGTLLGCTGTVRSEGRLAESGDQAATAAAHRLLDRFAAQLAAGLEAAPAGTTEMDEEGRTQASEGDESAADRPEPGPGDAPQAASVFETEVPPPSLDPLADANADAGTDGMDDSGADSAEEPPAEAAHARRTMIGRSAEEVDHAPPRGRYAPAPAPDGASVGATLRWAAPAAAAVVVAGAVVVGRMLRRRR